MSKSPKYPAIRFAGFTDAWEQRKLGEICQITMGQSPDGATYSETPSGYILVQGNADLCDGWVLPRIWTSQKTKTAERGDLILSVRAPAGAMGKTAFDVVLGRGVAGIKGNEFIYQTLVKKDLEGYWKVFATGSTFESINSEIIYKTSISIPKNFKEQSLIGDFLRRLDNLITLHQRKLDKLKSIKKSCLEKMFPRDGASVPEVRFAGFTDAWEQRKAKEIFVSTSDKGHPDLPVLSATQDRGMIRRDENSINVFHDKSNEAGYKRVLPGQFVIHLRSFQGGFAHSKIEGITSPAYTVFGFSNQDEHDSEYWKYIFSSLKFIKRLETVTYGIRDGRSINYEEFLTLNFTYPNRKEQTQIADLLDNLDNLITLHQRKLDKLKNIKKACLEKMFV